MTRRDKDSAPLLPWQKKLKKSMAPTKEKVSINIPNDLAFGILSKLPVKSLKRFSCVCKLWANLFENPQFMSIYRNNFLSKDDDFDSCLLKQSMRNTHRNSLFLLSGEMYENRVKLDWPPPFQEDDVNIYVSDSVVNGILCLYQSCGSDEAQEIPLKVVLWNPSTKEFKVIPPGFVDRPLGVEICADILGFGYDPVTDDYKLLLYFYFFVSYWDDIVEDYQCSPKPSWKTYSLKSNSWRKLEMPYIDFKHETNHVYCNGVCHCLGSFKQSDQEEWAVVSFNLTDEVFYKTPLDSNGCYAVFGRHLVVLKGSIAMISMYANTPCFDISILGELGVIESWTKLFSIGPLPCVEQPIGVGKKGDIFFRKNDDELARFDLSSQMIEKIGVKGEDEWCQIVIYKESILPIGRINN